MCKNILVGLLLFIFSGLFFIHLLRQPYQEIPKLNPLVSPLNFLSFPVPINPKIKASSLNSVPEVIPPSLPEIPKEAPPTIQVENKAEAPNSNPEPPTVLTPVAIQLPLGKLTTTISDSSQEKTVYLTFDDGPGNNTRKIVDILDKNQILGSFFWIGNNLASWSKRDPSSQSLIEEMLKKGDVIGSHTMDHTSLKNKGIEAQVALIKESVDYISEKVGKPIHYFRPPYGAVDQNTAKASEETKQIIAYWQVDSEDWKYPKNPDRVLNNIMSEVAPGAIILLHEKATTVEMLQQIINALKEKGYHFAPLPNPK